MACRADCERLTWRCKAVPLHSLLLTVWTHPVQKASTVPEAQRTAVILSMLDAEKGGTENSAAAVIASLPVQH